MRYNNYHKHDMFGNIRSLDCVVKPIEYIQRAKELDGDKAIFFSTNHGYQGNMHEYYTLCKDNGIKLIAGVETYYVSNRFEKDKSNYHLIIIAKNQNGYKAINKIMSEANLTGYYYKPRIDDELLFNLNPNDVVITTACVAGRLRDIEGSEEWIIKMKHHFKESFYLEVQNHNEKNQIKYNKRILRYAEKFDIQIIHANDSHYIKPEDGRYRDLFLNAKGINYDDESNFILDYPSCEEVIERYKKQGVLSDGQINNAINNTLIFDNFEGIKFDDEIKMPHVSDNPEEELGDIIKKEFKKELKNIDKSRKNEYIEEIKKEWEVISETNMYEYFLLNYKMIKLATTKYKGVITKTGRGSSPSFYINKLLHFTNIDRLESPVTLYPSRFMSATRILETKSLPDVDTNVASQKEFIDASKELLGEDSCQWMITFKPLQDSSAFRLYCKSIGLNIKEYDEIAKNLDDYKDDEKWKIIIEESNHFKGVIESVSQSPCSTLLLTEPISEEVGLLKVGDVVCCNLDGINCDRYKYLKNDILNVLVWKLIDETCKLIGIPIPTIKELMKLLDDKTYKMYELGLTCTLNQADSEFATDLFMKYKPSNIAEVSQMVCMLRPGAASMLNDFIERKPYTTGIEELDNLLSDSEGRMCYQESVMSFLIWLGVPESESYGILKKIAKKNFKQKELNELNKQLTKGWLDKVGSMDGYDKMWDIVEANAKYSFNASHSLSVGLDSLYGAYLKSHYPLEYYTVALNNYEGDIERTTKLTKELEYFKIKLENPKFRKSGAKYSLDKKTNSIYKGVNSIKFLNESVANYLYSLRENKYKTFTDLLIDLQGNINSKQLNILISLDFFSEFGKSAKLMKTYENFQNIYSKKQLSKDKFFGDIYEKYASKVTAKKYMYDDVVPLLYALEKKVENKELPIVDRIRCWYDNVGNCNLTDKNYTREVVILDIDNKYATKIRCYCINNSHDTWIKIGKKAYKNNPIEVGDLVYLDEMAQKEKKRKTDNGWESTGEYELWCNSYWKCELN